MTSTREIRAGLYCRISDDRGGQSLGVERQRKDCVRLADEVGWKVADTYTDNDLSAYSGRRRPEYERLLSDIGAGRITGVITWHPDRLNRSPLELERLIDLLERKSVAVASVTAGFFDLGNPSGRAVARTLGAWARFESEHKSERIKAKKYEQALQGAPNPGAFRPFGYTRDQMSIVASEAKVTRELMRRLLAGASLTELRDYTDNRGIVTTMGNRWTTSSIGRMLTSARIAGWRGVPVPRTMNLYCGAPFLVKGQWPPIVSRGDVERARLLLSDWTLRAGSSKRWLLSWLAVCGVCGSPLVSHIYDRPKRRYSCLNAGSYGIERCGRISVNCGIEDDVTNRLFVAVKGGLLARVRAAGAAAFDPSIEGALLAEQRIRRVGEDRDDGIIDTHEWLARCNRIRRRSTAELETTAALNETDLPALLRSQRGFLTAWPIMTMRQQRNTLRILTREIAVLPGRKGRHDYQYDRLQVTWRA